MSINENIVSAGIGLVGAIIGGIATYLSVDKQLKFEREKILNEEKEKLNTALSIIKTFLIAEIRKNYELIQNGDPSGELIEILKRKQWSETVQIGTFKFVYDNYDKIKYDIIKYNVQDVIDTIEIYQTFRFIEEKKDIRHNELKENEKELVKNGISKCENMIESS